MPKHFFIYNTNDSFNELQKQEFYTKDKLIEETQHTCPRSSLELHAGQLVLSASRLTTSIHAAHDAHLFFPFSSLPHRRW